MTNTESLVSVLAHHRVCAPSATEQTATDDARAMGILWACLGCGSVGCAPVGMTTEQYAASDYIRDLIHEWAECCPHAESVVFA